VARGHPDGIVIVPDLAKDPVPHIDAGRFGALLSKPAERTAEQQRVVDSDSLIDELARADVIVLRGESVC
jgi:FMN-dependent NADH-azoreductase